MYIYIYIEREREGVMNVYKYVIEYAISSTDKDAVLASLS